ncbi:sulfatase-like hydrolase/transferase [Chloroflexi bacterium TSY]|nr:sulfatase-like hydrolase/transferase [Chloroflexi bacterium TSY]
MKPNVILIVVDSLRYDHVGAHGGRPSLTPYLDRLSAESVVFDQTISQGPVTRVSMSSMMSSTYASMYGRELMLGLERPIVQDALHKNGYKTIAFSTNPHHGSIFGWERGFDYFDHCDVDLEYKRSPLIRWPNQLMKRLGRPLTWPTTLCAKSVFRSVRSKIQDSSQPFFLWTHLMDVHWPYNTQTFSWNPENQAIRNKFRDFRLRLFSKPESSTKEEVDWAVEAYRASVRYTDAQVGAFIDWLEQSQ